MKKIFFILLFLPLLLQAQKPRYPVPGEYRNGYVCDNDTLYCFNNGSPKLVAFPLPGGLKVDTAVGGFNSFLVIDNVGSPWLNKNDNTTTWQSMSPDATGKAIIDAKGPAAYGATYALIRKTEGSIWYGGGDTLHLFHSAGAVNLAFTRLSPAGMVFQKVVIGQARVIGLTTGGDVYEWTWGAGPPPKKKALPGPAQDIAASHFDYAVALVGGHPYVWGSSFGAWGGNNAYSQPVDQYTAWGCQEPISKINIDWNTTTFIGQSGAMYAFGYNVQGEVGIGTELVNQYTYPAPYSWDFRDYQGWTGLPAKRIAPGVLFKNIYGNAWFGFYKVAVDVDGDLWFWGRDKALASGRGFINMNEDKSPNALDVLAPLKVDPMAAVRKQYNFQPPVISVTPQISGMYANIPVTGHPALLINTSNSKDTLAYKWVKYSWSPWVPTAARLNSGNYTLQVIAADSNGGTAMAKASFVIVAPPAPVAKITIDSATIHSPNSIVRVSGDSSNGAGITYQWSQLGGPTAAIVTPIPGSRSGSLISGLFPGMYTFQLQVADSLGRTSLAGVTVNVIPLPACPPQVICPVCPVCPPARTVTGATINLNGTTYPIPLNWLKITFSDGSTQ